MTELTDEEAKALLAECDNPDCLTCEYARALLDARAELARVKADAAAAQAMVVERCAEFVERQGTWMQEHNLVGNRRTPEPGKDGNNG